jgi:hypothetical protein
MPTTELLNLLLDEVEADELTGLWALSYELSNKKSLDKKDTINLINKINDNLKILFAEPLPKNIKQDSIFEQDQENDLLPNDIDYIKAPQIEENINQVTLLSLLEILKEKNPLFKIEEDLLPSTITRLIPPTEPIRHFFDNHTASTKHFIASAKPDIASAKPDIASAKPDTASAAGIKKSRRKKRKRTKRKRTKRKRSKHKRSKRKRTKRKRTKRKRTKRKRSKKTGGALMAAAAAEHAAEKKKATATLGPLAIAAEALAAEEKNAEVQVTSGHGRDPSEIILPSIYQLRLNLRVGGAYEESITDWLIYYGGLKPIKAQNISDRLLKDYGVKKVREFRLLNELVLFDDYISKNFVLSTDESLNNLKTAFKMLTLHSEGAGCGYNTGSIVRNLVCDKNDIFCLIGCPGPNFKDKGPIEGAMVLRNDETRAIISEQKSRLEQKYNLNEISVIILEDEDYYKKTTELGLYDEIPGDNRIHIPCIDMQAHDSIEYMDFIEIIKKKRKQEHMIITHCFCGKGRTSSMIMCCKLYFLIDNILKTTPAVYNTLLNIPRLFGITDINDMKNFNVLGTFIEYSDPGQWLIKNYRTYSSRAKTQPGPSRDKTQPGHEFLNVSKLRKLFLFIDRMNAISNALAHFFKIPFYIVVEHNGHSVFKFVFKFTPAATPEAKKTLNPRMLQELVINFAL